MGNILHIKHNANNIFSNFEILEIIEKKLDLKIQKIISFSQSKNNKSVAISANYLDYLVTISVCDDCISIASEYDFVCIKIHEKINRILNGNISRHKKSIEINKE